MNDKDNEAFEINTPKINDHGKNVKSPAAPILSVTLPPQFDVIIDVFTINCNTITSNT